MAYPARLVTVLRDGAGGFREQVQADFREQVQADLFGLQMRGPVLSSDASDIPGGVRAIAEDWALGSKPKPYSLARHARAALDALRRLADPYASDESVLALVRRYGDPMRFVLWLDSAWTIKGKEMFTFGHLPPHFDQALLATSGWMPTLGGGPDFERWCSENGDLGAAEYTDWALQHLDEEDFAIHATPIAFYRWIADQTDQLAEELEKEPEQLGAQSAIWLSQRLRGAYLAYDDQARTIAIRPDSPLTYLTMQLVLGVGLERLTERICPLCGTPFVASRADQVYCKPRHRDTARKRRQRAAVRDMSSHAEG